MSPFLLEQSVCIPGWVVDFESFRRWTLSDSFPENGRISHLNGNLWVDLSMENLAHNRVKGIIAAVLTMLVEAARSGLLLPDGMRLVNADVALSTEPDAMFISNKTLHDGRARLEHGLASMEVEGTPDMVLEVISPSSVQKDTVVQRELYWKAGVSEYWLVDPRGLELRFDILKRAAKGYVPARKQQGWIKSTVFGKSFRLVRRDDEHGETRFALEVR